ncbi:MAG: M20/M25/M40 family metallo-hydrolase, partial [Chloroflexi bacterium]|nr:M20/M25/M40 family metallo-hydrolase [Chloroflexota bacterium]
VPAEAEAFVDIRTTLKQDHETLRLRLRLILAELSACDPDFHADIEFIEDRPVVGITREEPIARISAEAFRDITGRQPVWNGVPGATDGTFLSAMKKIPCLVNGPGPRHMPHQADEYVEIDQIEECARMYVLSASRFLAPQG